MIYYEAERANPDNGIYHQRNHNLGFFRHLHDSFEFIYVYEGEIEVTVDGCSFSVKAEQGILVFPNQVHSARTLVRSRSYLCVFQNSLIGEFFRTAKHSAVQNPVFRVPNAALIERIEKGDRSRYALKSHLYEMVALFEESCGAYVKRNKPIEHIGQLLSFISEHYAEPITMQEAAREIGYDHRYLSNLLQKGLGTTFRCILNEYRISYAQYLLKTGQGTVSSVAAECGYDSICSFNRNFRKITSLSPTDYRVQRGAFKKEREDQDQI